jgi:hypothetical protein
MDRQYSFDQMFEALTGVPPFPWQRKLFEKFVHEHSSDGECIPSAAGIRYQKRQRERARCVVALIRD